jgi:hypothetical protein
MIFIQSCMISRPFDLNVSVLRISHSLSGGIRDIRLGVFAFTFFGFFASGRTLAELAGLPIG